MFFSKFDQARYELKSLLLGYPDFVYAPATGNIQPQRPVFVFHTIDLIEFEQQLTFLRENGIQTVSADEYVGRLASPPEKGIDAVLLTVDDGRSSFWRFGFPLLKRYGMKATLFIIPGRTIEHDLRRWNLDDVWAGRCELKAVHAEDPDDVAICSWAEIREMYDSGLVDIQSHSLFHGEVFSGSELVDFISSETPMAAYETPVTPYLQPSHAGVALDRAEFLGLPLYSAAPLYRGEGALRPTDELKDFCRTLYAELYSQNDGDSGWKSELRAQVAKRFPDGGLRRETVEQTASSIRADMQRATAMIRDELDDSAGAHLCFPYSQGSELAVSLARAFGIRSCFWGVMPGHRANTPDTDPWHLVRIKSDFLWRLPGRNRATLFGTYWRKTKRRLRGERFY